MLTATFGHGSRVVQVDNMAQRSLIVESAGFLSRELGKWASASSWFGSTAVSQGNRAVESGVTTKIGRAHV